jgi:hypothetical protein
MSRRVSEELKEDGEPKMTPCDGLRISSRRRVDTQPDRHASRLKEAKRPLYIVLLYNLNNFDVYGRYRVMRILKGKVAMKNVRSYRAMAMSTASRVSPREQLEISKRCGTLGASCPN